MKLFDWLCLDEFVFDGELFGGFSGLLGGGLVIFFAVVWLLMAIFAPHLLNQSTTVACLIPGIIILIGFIRNFVKSIIKGDKKLIIYDSITCVLVVIAFIKGFAVPYHSIQYHYEYIGFWSAIATTTWLIVVLTFIRAFFVSVDSDGEKLALLDKVKKAFIYLGIVFALFIAFILISQPVAFFISVTKHDDDFYPMFIRYNNEVVASQMKDFKYKSVGECLEAELPTHIRDHIDDLAAKGNDTDNYQWYIEKAAESYYPSGSYCYASDTPGRLQIDDYTVYLFYKDKKTLSEEYYYSFDYKMFSLQKITKEEYDSHRPYKNKK